VKELKTAEEIYQEMLECFAQRSGVEAGAGCDLSVRMYALAAQVCALYVQADWVTKQAFPQTAQGEYLDRHAQLRGLERKSAAAAEGIVRFTAGETSTEARTIPQGTVCVTAGLVRFETVQAGTLAAGELTVDLPVRAVEAGTAGNIAAGAIVSMAVAPVGISGCTNPASFSGGADQEGDEELRERVLDTFQRLPNGANAAFYQQEALSFDQVAGAAVVARPRGVGSVDVVVSTLTGMPSQRLLDEISTYFQTRREIAVDVQVRQPETVTVDLAVEVAAKEGWELEQVLGNVRQTLTGWFDGTRLGQSVLRSQVGDLVYHCDGVLNYNITAPSGDVAVAEDGLPVLGTLKVEAMT
jgi:uncharacterized phage protein gp47/JayE